MAEMKVYEKAGIGFRDYTAPYHPLLDPLVHEDSFMVDPAGAFGVPGTSLDGGGNLSIATLMRGEGGAIVAPGDKYFLKQKTAATALLNDFAGVNPAAPANKDHAVSAVAGASNAGTAYIAYNMPVSSTGWTLIVAMRRGASMPDYAGQDPLRPMVMFPGYPSTAGNGQKVWLGGFDDGVDAAQTLAVAGCHLNTPGACSVVAGWNIGDAALFVVTTDATGVTLMKDGRWTGAKADYFDIDLIEDSWWLLGCDIAGASPNGAFKFLLAQPGAVAADLLAKQVAYAARRIARQAILPDATYGRHLQDIGPWQ